jgi:hypothetical protein
MMGGGGGSEYNSKNGEFSSLVVTPTKEQKKPE